MELSYKDFKYLSNYCKKKKLNLCTADEIEGLNQIKPYIKKIKIGSAELNDSFFLEKIAKLKKKLLFFQLAFLI